MVIANFTKKPFILIFLVVCLNTFASPFPADSIRKLTRKDSLAVSYFHNDFEKFGTLKVKPYDTGITGFQNYDPLFTNSQIFATLGNIGLDYRNLNPYPFMRQSGFDYGIHTFDNYLYQNDSVRYYRVVKAFTDLTYAQGAKKEIFFHAVFSRNVYRGLNIGFDFRVSNSPGAYQQQRSNLINFILTAEYFTKDRRYGVIANFIWNRIRDNENGGIKYDSIFEQDLEPNRQIYTVNLNSAQNRVRETGFFMKHYFNLTRHPRTTQDTAVPVKKRVELGRLAYSFEYNRQIQNYIDNKPNSGFYQNIYLDSLLSYDSITLSRIVNEVIWTNPSFNREKKFRLLQIEAHLKQLYSEVRYHEIKDVFLEYIPSAQVSFHPYSSLLLYVYGDYVFGDYNNGDLSLKVNLSQVLGKPDHNVGTIALKGFYCFQKAGWFYEHYLGNNFRWDTTWQRQNIVSGGFSYALKGLEAGFNISRLNHFVYLDTAAMPAQNNSDFGYISAYLNTDLDLWKFKFRSQLVYQTVQGTNDLRLPSFVGSLTIYFTQILFKSHATLQPGLNFFYNTLYYGNGYMPATRSFYLQDNKEIGNYLYMDVFVNVKIQRARFFVKYSNFDSFFMGRHYYMVPGYPMQDAAFKFGISWNFHD
jgi:hypothetical protein